MNLKELFNDALPLIKTFAPTIGAALGNPVGAAAGYVVPLLANMFDSHPTEVTKIVGNILTDPESDKKLTQIENEYGTLINALINSVNHLSEAELNLKLKWQNDKQGS